MSSTKVTDLKQNKERPLVRIKIGTESRKIQNQRSINFPLALLLTLYPNATLNFPLHIFRTTFRHRVLLGSYILNNIVHGLSLLNLIFLPFEVFLMKGCLKNHSL